MPTAFVGLLFAVLAAGCQSSDMPGKERELTSQVYGTYDIVFTSYISWVTKFPPSLLCLSIFTSNELRIPTNFGRNTDSLNHWECSFV